MCVLRRITYSALCTERGPNSSTQWRPKQWGGRPHSTMNGGARPSSPSTAVISTHSRSLLVKNASKSLMQYGDWTFLCTGKKQEIATIGQCLYMRKMQGLFMDYTSCTALQSCSTPQERPADSDRLAYRSRTQSKPPFRTPCSPVSTLPATFSTISGFC